MVNSIILGVCTHWIKSHEFSIFNELYLLNNLPYKLLLFSSRSLLPQKLKQTAVVEASVTNVMNSAPRFTGNKQAIKRMKQTISTKRTPRKISTSSISNRVQTFLLFSFPFPACPFWLPLGMGRSNLDSLALTLKEERSDSSTEYLHIYFNIHRI